MHIFIITLNLNNFPDNPLHAENGSLWTIPLEIQCYLLIMALGIFLEKPALIFFAIMLSLWTISGGQHTKLYIAYLGLFFGMGALCHQYPIILRAGTLFLLASTGTTLIMMEQTILGLLLLYPLAIKVGLQSWILLKDLGRWGDLSYGTYIYAWPIQQLYISWLGAETPYMLLLLPSAATTLLMAYLSWHLIEKPFMSMKPKKYTQKSYPLKT